MSVHSASPGGTANSMGMKGSNVGIWAQAGKNIKAGTAIKPTTTTEELDAEFGTINDLPAFAGGDPFGFSAAINTDAIDALTDEQAAKVSSILDKVPA